MPAAVSTPKPTLQDDLFRAMSDPGFYPRPVSDLQTRETHISKVFLTGSTVYKLKKAVKLAFLDYSTLAKRKTFCHQELTLNRRLAPEVYLGVVPITRRDSRFFLNGPGEPIEYAVKMRQLPENHSLKWMLRQKTVDRAVVEKVARRLASFYRAAAADPAIDAYGSIETIRSNCEENFRELSEVSCEVLDEAGFRAIQAATRSYLMRCSARFEDRIQRGKIRDCHGDLRTDHIYFDGGLQIIDCIEFNDRFRYSDVASDLAFLAMDLDYEGFPALAQHLIDAYVRYSKDAEVYLLLDFYKCYRALVRSKICYLMLRGLPADGFSRKRLERDIRKYLSLAFRYAVRFNRPTLYVTCGLPASGKSTIAAKLSAILHVDILQSDRIRKALFDIGADTTVDVPFESGVYSSGSTALTYGKLFLLAQEALEQGKSIILDATFSRDHQRREALQLARDMDVNILFIECWAPLATLEQRLKARKGATSLSDARLHHLPGMVAHYKPFDTIDRDCRVRIDTREDLEESVQKILSHDYCLLSELGRRVSEALDA
jgi:aminoglycoside phosphotransferase family enzyme/predicted kinase